MTDDELLSRQHPLREDMAMQQRVWRFERVSGYELVVIVLFGLAGVFGMRRARLTGDNILESNIGQTALITASAFTPIWFIQPPASFLAICRRA